MTLQLEFNFDNKSEEQLKFEEMQKQFDDLKESMGKVRRKVFSEVTEVKKLYAELKKSYDDLLEENKTLKNTLKENEKTKWTYAKEDYLFYV